METPRNRTGLFLLHSRRTRTFIVIYVRNRTCLSLFFFLMCSISVLFYYMFHAVLLYFSSAAFVTYQSYCYRINNTKIKSLPRSLCLSDRGDATAFTGHHDGYPYCVRVINFRRRNLQEGVNGE